MAETATGTPTRTERIRSLGGVYVASLLVVLLFASLGLYYYFRVLEKRSQLMERDLRILAVKAQQVTESVNGARTVFGNSALPSGPGFTRDLDVATYQRELAELDRAIPWLAITVSPLDQVDYDPALSCQRDTGPEARFDARLQSIELSCQIELEAARFEVTGRARLAELVAPYLRSEVFDSLLVASRDGRVLYGQGASALILRRLDGKAAGDSEKGAAAPDMDASSVREQRIGDRQYLAFRQPLGIEIAEADAPLEAVLVGLVDLGRFRRDERALDGTRAALLVLFLLLVVLSLPFLKVGSIHPPGRATRPDLCALIGSLVLASAVLSIALIDGYWYPVLQSQAGANLEALAEQVESNFSSEIDDALAQLDDFDRRPDGRASLECGRPNRHLDSPIALGQSTLYPFLDMVFWTDARGFQISKKSRRAWPTPSVSLAARQAFRDLKAGDTWSSRNFRRAGVAGSEPEAKGGSQDRGHDFVLESILSRNTGEQLVLLGMSMPTPTERPSLDQPANDRGADENGAQDSGNCAPTQPKYSFLISKMRSVISPVLAPGHGFAIFTPDGQVILHSDPANNLRESIFEATWDDPKLRAASYARVERTFNTRYRERDVRMHVHPTQVGDLSIATFLDLRFLRTANFEIATLSLFLFVIYLLVLSAFLVLGWLVSGRPRQRWMWPDPQRPQTHWLSFSVLAFAIVVCSLFQPLAPKALLPITYFVPAAALGFCLLHVARALGDPKLRRWGLWLVGLPSAALVFSLDQLADWAWMLLVVFYLGCLAAVAVHRYLLARAAGQKIEKQTIENVGRALATLTLSVIPRRWLPSSGTKAHPGSRSEESERDAAVGATSAEAARQLRRRYSTPYLLTACSALLLVGMLPASTFFRAIHFDHLRLYIQHGQLELARQLDLRRHQISKTVESAEQTLYLCDDRDIYARAFFDTRYRPIGPDGKELTCGDVSRSGWIEPDTSFEDATRDGADPFDRSAKVHQYLSAFPLRDELSVRTRYLSDMRSADGSAVWWRVGRGSRPEDPRHHPFFLRYRPTNGPLVELSSSVPGLSAPIPSSWKLESWRQIAPLWLSVALVLGILFWGVRFVACSLLLLDLKPVGLRGESPDAAAPDTEAASVAQVERTSWSELWDSLESDQRITLTWVARGEFPVRPSRGAVSELLERGILARDPELRIADPELDDWIEDHVDIEQVVDWRQETASSLWRQVRGPISLALVGVAAFLFFTQREAFQATIAFVAALTASLPVVLRFLGPKPATDK